MKENRTIKIGFDTNDQTFFSENIICVNQLSSANFRFLLGEYGDSTLHYIVIYDIAERGDICVISLGASWAILGKASLPQERWASWVENLIQQDINKVYLEDSHYAKKSLPDNPDDFDMSGEPIEEEMVTGTWKPKGVLIIGFNNAKKGERFAQHLGDNQPDGCDGTGRYYSGADATLVVKMIESNSIRD